MMKTKLLIAAIALVGFSACAPKYTCPTYAVKEIKKEAPVEKTEQLPM